MAMRSPIIVSTTFDVQGRRIREYKGVVRGITVRAPTIAQGILGGLKSIVGGQIGAYTEMCEQARARTAGGSECGHRNELRRLGGRGASVSDRGALLRHRGGARIAPHGGP